MNAQIEPSTTLLVTGPPAAGKRSLCRLLAQLSATSVHIPVSDIQDWVVAGRASIEDEWTSETDRQMRDALRIAFFAAEQHQLAGFQVLLEHFFMADDLKAATQVLGAKTRGALLLPRLEVNILRNWQREAPENRLQSDEELIRSLQAYFRRDTKMQDAGWIVIDNSDLTVEETANAVLAQLK